jgi:hypothetical protein
MSHTLSVLMDVVPAKMNANALQEQRLAKLATKFVTKMTEMCTKTSKLQGRGPSRDGTYDVI